MSPQSWSIQMKSLFLRCVTEMSNSRKMERALAQLELLVNTFKKTTPCVSKPYVYIHLLHAMQCDALRCNATNTLPTDTLVNLHLCEHTLWHMKALVNRRIHLVELIPETLTLPS